jgi:NAD(P)-dependent dehydrogenase (short-subunit alcohol dehydrogenase family)
MTKRKLTALVTGGSNGIGEAICRHFLDRGDDVVNVDIQAPRQALGTYIGADLADAAATKEAAARIARDFAVDVIVNNAGNPTPGFLDEVTGAQFEMGVGITMRTPLLLAQALVPGMRQRKFGRIVSISSRSILGKPARTVYSATKAAMVGFTRTWALELGKDGITVNAIAPGPVATELFKKNNPPEIAARIIAQTSVGRTGTPEDIARAVMFFAEPDNGFITGQVLHVCGGTSLVVNW